MASPEHVRQYIAYWFQLGKPVLLKNGEESLLPEPVFQGNRYSDSFERCWNRILRSESGDCYLQGTRQTIAELLSQQWDIVPCARCDMPVPLVVLGNAADFSSCPCNDLPSWPNTELPTPRSAIDSTDNLDRIRRRLSDTATQSQTENLQSQSERLTSRNQWS